MNVQTLILRLKRCQPLIVPRLPDFCDRFEVRTQGAKRIQKVAPRPLPQFGTFCPKPLNPKPLVPLQGLGGPFPSLVPFARGPCTTSGIPRVDPPRIREGGV